MKQTQILGTAAFAAVLFLVSIGIQMLLGAAIGLPEILITAVIVLAAVTIVTLLTRRRELRRAPQPND